MLKFGEVLRELREERRLTQQELAARLHISSSSISAYEIGAALPPMERAMELADFFDVPLDYLLGRSALRCELSVLRAPIYRDRTLGELVSIVSGLPGDLQEIVYKTALGLTYIPKSELE